MSHSKLDRAAIVQAALELLSDEGLAHVSLRKLAGRLGVTVSSLYWHIRDRDELLALMCETVFRECLEATPETDDWPGWLRAFAQVLWRKQFTLRDCQKLIIVSTLDRATRTALQDAVAGRLAVYAVGRDQGTLMQMSVQALVTGWSTLDPEAETEREFEAALAALLAGWEAQLKRV